jgi:hypothetical protein
MSPADSEFYASIAAFCAAHSVPLFSIVLGGMIVTTVYLIMRMVQARLGTKRSRPVLQISILAFGVIWMCLSVLLMSIGYGPLRPSFTEFAGAVGFVFAVSIGLLVVSQ